MVKGGGELKVKVFEEDKRERQAVHMSLCITDPQHKSYVRYILVFLNSNIHYMSITVCITTSMLYTNAVMRVLYK